MYKFFNDKTRKNCSIYEIRNKPVKGKPVKASRPSLIESAVLSLGQISFGL